MKVSNNESVSIYLPMNPPFPKFELLPPNQVTPFFIHTDHMLHLATLNYDFNGLNTPLKHKE
jgi:hypothetical protein